MSIQIHVCLLLCVIQCLGWFAIGLYIPGNTNDFERNLRRAMETIKDVLDTDKLKVTQISNMPHKYDDKYYLSEFLTNTMIGATTNVLFKIMHGIDLNVEDDAGDRKKLFDFIRNSNKLSLEFQCVESSVFINTTNREVVHKGNKVIVEEEVETKSSGFFGSNQKTKTNEVSRRTTVVEVTEHFWEYSVSYEVVLVSTVNGMKADEYSLTKHNSVVDIVTSVKKNPYEHKRMLPMAIDLSWLKTMLQHQESQGSDISTDVYMSFHIDRGDVECKTPRRNRDISNALEYVSRLHQWALDVTKHLSYFEVKHLSLTEGGRIYCPDSSGSGEIFAPIVPFLLRYADDAGGDADVNHTRKYTKHDIHSVEWSENNIQRLLDMQMHSFDAFVDRAIRPKYPNSFEEARKRGSVYDVHTVSLMTSLVHLATICRLYTQGVDHIEFLIRRQLSDAVGKEVRVSDLTDYMNNFHVDRFFQPKYKLKPFSYAIRKTPMHSPEGSISLEQSANGGVAGYALPTITHYSQAPVSMHLQLNPSTTINFNSNLYVHGWLNHQFRDTDQNRFEIVAEARQFSSYILMFGRIPDLDTFEPLHAIVIKDKDLLRIPLDIELVPSLKAFKAAIESLSPEQKRFASAFRSMQLEHNSLLGLLVIPIKPQLERVLNLPEDALTKELQLNQDLMELFIEYQIPSDLLSCNEGITQFKEEGSNTDALDLSASTKISTVKSYVSSMNVCFVKIL